MPKILVAYGYHRGEPYSRDVGVLFSQINPFYPDVVVKKFAYQHASSAEPSRFGKDPTYWANLSIKNQKEMLQINSADNIINLHDDTPSLTRTGQVPKYYEEVYCPFQLMLHFCYSKTDKQFDLYEKEIEGKITPFRDMWNEQNKHKASVESCECYLNEHTCNLPGMTVEFHNANKKLNVEEGARFVGTLTRYLLSKF